MDRICVKDLGTMEEGLFHAETLTKRKLTASTVRDLTVLSLYHVLPLINERSVFS